MNSEHNGDTTHQSTETRSSTNHGSAEDAGRRRHHLSTTHLSNQHSPPFLQTLLDTRSIATLELLEQHSSSKPTAIDLCSGCGGIAESMRSIGFHILALFENDPRCVQTLIDNQFSNVVQAPIQLVDFTQYRNVTLLTGGLPCQPWSFGGKRQGEADSRNLWSHALRAAREATPRALLFEMVAGFLMPQFNHVRENLIQELQELGYTAYVRPVNARDYRLPQSRKRCFVIAHSEPGQMPTPQTFPPRTVRDMMLELGPPSGVGRHEERGMAREYSNHLASTCDRPSKTITAGTHGPGGGSNTVRLDNGTLRYFTIAEMAALQGFPPSYKFDPVWSHAVKQIGNACPPALLTPWLEGLSAHCNLFPRSSAATNEGVDHSSRDGGEDDESGPVLEEQPNSDDSEANAPPTAANEGVAHPDGLVTDPGPASLADACAKGAMAQLQVVDAPPTAAVEGVAHPDDSMTDPQLKADADAPPTAVDEGVAHPDGLAAGPQLESHKGERRVRERLSHLRNELHRREVLLNVLNAQAAVISGQCSDAIADARDSRPKLEAIAQELTAQAESLEADVLQATRPALHTALCYVNARLHLGKDPCDDSRVRVRRASLMRPANTSDSVDARTGPSAQPHHTPATGCSVIASSWRRARRHTPPPPTLRCAESQAIHAYTRELDQLLETISNERAAHITANREHLVAQMEAYSIKRDAAVPSGPDESCRFSHAYSAEGEAPTHFDASAFPAHRTMTFKVPKRLLAEDIPEKQAGTAARDATIKAVSLFNITRVDDDDDRLPYQAMKAALKMRGCTGEWEAVDSVVDSGAGWSAIRLSTLARKFPHLMSEIKPSKIKFKDASGNLMDLAGKVRMTIRLGKRELVTTVHVFNSLGADFLLGVNTLRQNRCVINCNTGRLYVDGEAADNEPLRSTMCAACEPRYDDVLHVSNTQHTARCDWCVPGATGSWRVECDADSCQLVLNSADGESFHIPCKRVAADERVQLMLREDVTIDAGRRAVLDPEVLGLGPQHLESQRTVEVETAKFLTRKLGLSCQEVTILNPTSPRTPLIVRNEGKEPVTIKAGTVVAREIVDSCQEEYVTMLATVTDEDTESEYDPPPPLDEGGIEYLKRRGFSLDKSIDPELRRADGSYEPLSPEKQRKLYEVALRWYHVWAVNPKTPKVSLLVVIDIPTGDAPPQAQAPYPIPAKLRRAASKEIETLLKGGLIEPSMSDWCSPALIRVKKDSELDEDGHPTKVKFAIDYRRVNALTQADAGGLGDQSDILHDIGGKNKYIGLCDAAGGFYQFLLSPSSKHRSAFILPTSMGGTLFQWKCAPYGLRRNPAGYSRGMQWTLRGMSTMTDLDDGRAKGGAKSWIDDVCMRTNTFEGFVDLFDRVLERMAASQMSFKGAKCELLHERCDLLGFVATPHGVMLQRPKLAKILADGVPTSPKEAKTFLGAVAFLRRMVPRISLLSGPMNSAVVSHEKRMASARRTTKTTAPGGAIAAARAAKSASAKPFSSEEQEQVRQSFEAIVEHLDGDSVVVSPDLDDPHAHFVICTDASDYAVGGVLMQWQRESTEPLAEPPPPDSKGTDPLDSDWRARNGYRLALIGFHSKVLVDSQKNYAIFDKEAGAILVCVRHWSDLISLHPTTVYTDSAVAASMLTKHAAPPRLQRWGLELGAFLPFLRISFRRGSDNGLADLLSRYPAFERFTTLRAETVELPDDLFDKIGDAPLFNPSAGKSEYRDHHSSSVYELCEPKLKRPVSDPIWCSPDAPEIPGRGLKDRTVPTDTGHDEYEAWMANVTGATGGADISPSLSDAALSSTAPTVDLDATAPTADLDGTASAAFLELCGRRPVVAISATRQLYDAVEEPLNLAGFACCARDDCRTPDVVLDFSSGSSPDQPGKCAQLAGGWPPPSPPCATLSTLAAGAAERALAVVSCGPTEFALQSCTGCPDPEAVHALSGHEDGPLLGDSGAVRACLTDLVDGLIAAYLRRELGWRRDPAMPSSARVFTGMPHRIAQHCNMCAVDGASGGDTGSPSDGEPPPRTFQWQEREGGASIPVGLDREPTAPITMDEQMGDPNLRLVIRTLNGDKKTPRSVRARASDRYELKDDALYWRMLRDGVPGLALAVPKSARASLLSRFHFSLGEAAGHNGGQRLYELLQRDYHWDGMESECHAFVAACEHCGGTRSQAAIGADTGVAPTPGRPFEVIHVDYKTLSMCDGYTAVLCVVCALTKFTLYIPVKSATAEHTLNALIDRVFSVFGCPLVIVSDNGTSFANALLRASAKLFGYRWIFVMPHTPQANGLAEAGVKKLKVILDRHTKEHQNWLRMIPMAMMSVNQRIASGTETPFTALFGTAPTTLAALENPELLPSGTAAERSVKDTAVAMARLHKRLQREVESLKRAAAMAEVPKLTKRRPVPGDKVWLLYSDLDRARYLRKHGHGRAWRHPYTVTAVKPHAVRLQVPVDGSVPEVLPWQSLRKCSFAAPYFHDHDLKVPDVDEHGLAMIPEESEAETVFWQTDDRTSLPASEQAGTPDDPMGWQPYYEDPTQKYEIERIVSAVRVGPGWSLQVKWKGYPDTTGEPLSRILKQVTHPDLLSQIEQCKKDYYMQHPAERESGVSAVLAAAAPYATFPIEQWDTRAEHPCTTFGGRRYICALAGDGPPIVAADAPAATEVGSTSQDGPEVSVRAGRLPGHMFVSVVARDVRPSDDPFREAFEPLSTVIDRIWACVNASLTALARSGPARPDAIRWCRLGSALEVSVLVEPVYNLRVDDHGEYGLMRSHRSFYQPAASDVDPTRYADQEYIVLQQYLWAFFEILRDPIQEGLRLGRNGSRRPVIDLLGVDIVHLPAETAHSLETRADVSALLGLFALDGVASTLHSRDGTPNRMECSVNGQRALLMVGSCVQRLTSVRAVGTQCTLLVLRYSDRRIERSSAPEAAPSNIALAEASMGSPPLGHLR